MVGYLLQATPPGSHDADIYVNALETISSFHQVNAIWARGGMAVSASAMVLEISGWQIMWRETGDGTDQKEKTPSSELLKLSYAEFAVSLILYVLFTWQSYIRLIPVLTTVTPGWSQLLVYWWVAVAFWTILLTYNWARGKVVGGKEPNGAVVVILWIVFVTEWPVICMVNDVLQLVTCIRGGACSHPLFLWKDAWSDFSWIY
jgi:hypothetical protein